MFGELDSQYNIGWKKSKKVTFNLNKDKEAYYDLNDSFINDDSPTKN